MNDLINKIQNELPDFSKGQKQIARFILEHYDKAAFMTAGPARRYRRCERVHRGALRD